MPAIEDAGDAVPHKERRLAPDRVLHRRKDFVPQLLDFLVLREEAMPSDVHPIPVIFHGSCKAADTGICLKDDWVDAGGLQELVGSRKPCRACPDDDCRLVFLHNVNYLLSMLGYRYCSRETAKERAGIPAIGALKITILGSRKANHSR